MPQLYTLFLQVIVLSLYAILLNSPKVQYLIREKNSGLDLKSICAPFLSILGGYFRYILTIAIFSVISYDMIVKFSRIQLTPAPTHIAYNTCDFSLKYGHSVLNFHLAAQPY